MRREYQLLLLIIVVASFLRLFNLTTVPAGLYPDEAMNGNNALEALATNDWKVFYPENNGREGLFINIQSASLALFGNEPWALRLPSTLFGILTVLGIYFLTKELFARARISFSPKPPEASGHGSSEARERAEDKRSFLAGETSGLRENEILALITAFLLAISFWHINFSRIGFRAIMAPAFLTWGTYLLLLVLNKIQSISPEVKSRGLIFLSLLAGAIYALGLHSYIAYRATPLLILFIIAAYWLKNKDAVIRKKILLSTFYFLLSSTIVFLPLGLYFLDNPADFFGRTTQVSVFASETPLKDLTFNILKTLGMFNFAGDYNWRHNIAGSPQLFWPVGIMFLIGVIISFRKNTHYKLFHDRGITCNGRVAILYAWLIVAALPVVISNEGIPHALRAIIMIPPVFILSGVGGVWIYQFLSKRINQQLLKTAMVFLIAILIAQAYYSYFIQWAKNPNTAGAFTKNYLEIGRELNKLAADQPKYVIVKAPGVDVRGLPMPAQTVMFITDTFTPGKQARKNIHYLLPDQIEGLQLPASAAVFTLN